MHVAAVLSAFVVAWGARPSLESKSLSLHMERSPKEKLQAWKMKDDGRFKDRCSFWGASFDEEDGMCRCGEDSESNPLQLVPRCMVGPYAKSFHPSAYKGLDDQLWNVNCRCETKARKQALPDDTDLLRIAAVDLCVNLLNKFDGKWEWDSQFFTKDYSQSARKATEGLDASKCAESLEDVEKAKISQGSGSTAFWQTALKHVCHEECEEIVDEMKRQSEEVLEVVSGRREASYSDACSMFVVRKVESHILGCCGDSCGWDGAKCALGKISDFCNLFSQRFSKFEPLSFCHC